MGKPNLSNLLWKWWIKEPCKPQSKTKMRIIPIFFLFKEDNFCQTDRISIRSSSNITHIKQIRVERAASELGLVPL